MTAEPQDMQKLPFACAMPSQRVETCRVAKDAVRLQDVVRISDVLFLHLGHDLMLQFSCMTSVAVAYPSFGTLGALGQPGRCFSARPTMCLGGFDGLNQRPSAVPMDPRALNKRLSTHRQQSF